MISDDVIVSLRTFVLFFQSVIVSWLSSFIVCSNSSLQTLKRSSWTLQPEGVYSGSSPVVLQLHRYAFLQRGSAVNVNKPCGRRQAGRTLGHKYGRQVGPTLCHFGCFWRLGVCKLRLSGHMLDPSAAAFFSFTWETNILINNCNEKGCSAAFCFKSTTAQAETVMRNSSRSKTCQLTR